MPGELLVRAAGADPRRGFFLGYLKDEAATEEAWAGGWFHTGDVVRRERRRRLALRRPAQERDPPQRREHLGGRGRERRSPQHPRGRTRSAVAATPDPVRGDEVLACIVLREGAEHAARPSSIATSIVAHALERLAYFKAPGYVAFVDALPLTASQKVQRGELRDAGARRCPAQPHCVDTARS